MSRRLPPVHAIVQSDIRTLAFNSSVLLRSRNSYYIVMSKKGDVETSQWSSTHGTVTARRSNDKSRNVSSKSTHRTPEYKNEYKNAQCKHLIHHLAMHTSWSTPWRRYQIHKIVSTANSAVIDYRPEGHRNMVQNTNLSVVGPKHMYMKASDMRCCIA